MPGEPSIVICSTAEGILKEVLPCSLDIFSTCSAYIQMRCKLAAVLLALHDYDACNKQLLLATQQVKTEQEQQMLQSILSSLQVQWPHL